MIIAIEIMLLAVNNLQFEYVFLFINSTFNINLLDIPNIFNIYFCRKFAQLFKQRVTALTSNSSEKSRYMVIPG